MITASERKRIAKIISTTKDEDFIRKIESLISSKPKVIRRKKKNGEKQVTEFQKYLLTWPVMMEEEMKEIKERRKRLNEWR
jgi:hypothetical protein